jgi:hypothetical protein
MDKVRDRSIKQPSTSALLSLQVTPKIGIFFNNDRRVSKDNETYIGMTTVRVVCRTHDIRRKKTVNAVINTGTLNMLSLLLFLLVLLLYWLGLIAEFIQKKEFSVHSSKE